MRQTKIIPQPKKDVEALDNDMLSEVAGLKEHPGFKALGALMQEFVKRRTEDVLREVEGARFEEIGIRMSNIRQMQFALEYFMDSPLRAFEELERRSNSGA